VTSGVEIARESTSGNPQADLAVGQAYLAAVVLGRVKMLGRLRGDSTVVGETLVETQRRSVCVSSRYGASTYTLLSAE
jgi:hypothetical protein